MKPFKNLLFDFGGVLLDLNPQACIDAFKELGCPADVFQGEFWLNGIFVRIDRGTATESEFYDEMRGLGKIPNASDKEILDAWNKFIAGVMPGVLEALDELRKKYPLYMLSNASLMHWRYCWDELMLYQGKKVDGWFKKRFVSYEMQLEKPEPEIYLEVIRQAGIKPDETLFIDDRQENLDTAAKLGFQTQITRNGDWIDRLL